MKKNRFLFNGDNKLALYSLRDIFDIDMAILKGWSAFPIGKKEGESVYAYEQYEGWTADNMFLALSRVASEWNDYYEFDIPYEIGTESISSNDIEQICDVLKETYGEEFTEEREDGIRLALTWVGRGHYSDSKLIDELREDIVKLEAKKSENIEYFI